LPHLLPSTVLNAAASLRVSLRRWRALTGDHTTLTIREQRESLPTVLSSISTMLMRQIVLVSHATEKSRLTLTLCYRPLTGYLLPARHKFLTPMTIGPVSFHSRPGWAVRYTSPKYMSPTLHTTASAEATLRRADGLWIA